MKKEIHIWMNNSYPDNTHHDHLDLLKAIRSGEMVINTTCSNILNGGWIDMGYRMFLHTYGKKVFEINKKQVRI